MSRSRSGSPARALLWDNDGVLVDTEPLFFRATCEILEGTGISVSRELYVDYAMRHGRSLFELVAERGAVSLGECVDACGVSRSAVKNDIRTLIDKGVIRREGRTHRTRYRAVTP